MTNDYISRQAAIDAIHGRIFQQIVVEHPSYNTYPEYIGKPYFSIKYTENGQEFIGYGTYKPEVLSKYLKEYFIPSAQPDLNEWCTDCKEYDKERSCCHRWKKVIRETVEELKQAQRWIPCSERLPEGGREILVTEKGGFIRHCEYANYGDFQEFQTVKEGLTVHDVIAWMPLPEPYKGEEPFEELDNVLSEQIKDKWDQKQKLQMQIDKIKEALSDVGYAFTKEFEDIKKRLEKLEENNE